MQRNVRRREIKHESRDFEIRKTNSNGRGRGRGNGGRGGRGGGGGRNEWENGKERMAAIKSKLDGLNLVSEPKEYDSNKLVAKPDNGGKAGRPIPLYSNHFLMECHHLKSYQYDVEITEADQRPLGENDTTNDYPRPISAKRSKIIVQQCSDDHNWGSDWVYDGKKTLYATKEHPLFTKVRKEFPVQIQINNRTKRFNVYVQWTATIDFLDLNRYMQNDDVEYPEEATRNLEIALRHGATKNPNCFISGRSLYFNDPMTNKELPGGAELWLGYYQSVKLCQAGLCLNIDTTCTTFLTRVSVIDFLKSNAQVKSPDGLSRLNDKQHELLNDAISSLKIKTTHCRTYNKKHIVKRLTKQPASSLTFIDNENRTKTVAQYFEETYKKLRYPHLPCLDVSKNKDHIIYLPLEVCEILAGQRQKRLTDEQTRQVITSSAVKPSERKKNIISSLEKVNSMSHSAIRKYKTDIDNKMIKMDGRILPGPHLEYKNSENMDTGDRGAWNLENVQFYKGVQIRSWAVIDLTGRNIANIPGEEGLCFFIDALIGKIKKLGMKVPDGLPPLIIDDIYHIEDSLRLAIEKTKIAYGQDKPDFVLVILPGINAWSYQEIKRVSEGKLGIITQCMLAKKAGIGAKTRGLSQYLANLTMKINHKIGGVNCQILNTMSGCFPLLGQGKNRPFIVFGADVTHPISTDLCEPSIGAVVASMDLFLGQFSARILRLKHRTEKLVGLKDVVKELLKAYYKKNNTKPAAIFYYRDGISKGELKPYMKHEYEEFHRAFEELENGYKPPITFVVAQKRHHTRFFPANPKDGDRNGNIHPGTVIDSGITSKFDFDFYLNSHAGIQGTNKPAHYYVLIDENGFGSDGMQMFTYWMCYLYCRCTRSVSYAPPAYYAHLAAFHGKYLIDRNAISDLPSGEGKTYKLQKTNPELTQKMYFV